MQDVGGCSRSNCTVSPRCNDCEHNFVDNVGDVCSNCAPATCEYCAKKTKKLFKVSDDIGFGQLGSFSPSTLKLCEECNNRLCMRCREYKDNLTEYHICYDCNSDWIPSGRHMEVCSDCGKERVLNEEGLCKSCFAKNEYERDQEYNKVRCANNSCQRLFTPLTARHYICPTCEPICLGCDDKFNPDNRLDTMCVICTHKAQKGMGECSSCYQHSDYLDIHAHCNTCSETYYDLIDNRTRAYYCRICETNITTSQEEACESCADKYDICPDCMRNKKKVEEYLCESCKERRLSSIYGYKE